MSDRKSPVATEQKPKRNKKGRLLRGGLVIVAVGGATIFAFWWYCLRMPGKSFQASASVVQPEQERKSEPKKEKQVGKTNQQQTESGIAKPVREKANTIETDQAKPKLSVEEELKSYVVHLADTIGERNLHHHEELCEAADYIENKFKEFGYKPKRQTYKCVGLDCYNIDVEITGSKKPEEIVIIGGHYDSVFGSPGANDNGSGTAAMMVLANHFRKAKPERTLRFVAWTNEEPPYFQKKGKMGSWVYAAKCAKEGQDIVAVLSLETLGYYTNAKDSQKYPAVLKPFFPKVGNFVGFVANTKSGGLQRQVIKKFREHAKVPSEGAALPSVIQGVGWSDHWSFWQEGYVGLMVTDTAPFRYPHYHLKSDTPDKINYPEFAKVIDGLVPVIEDLAEVKSKKLGRK